ncbi:MAG: hypothetical protein ABWW66_05090 [Archaeoglobaceae archaeon]
MKNFKKLLFAATLALSLIFAALSFAAFSAPSVERVSEVVGEVGGTGTLKHEAVLLNNTLYGERMSAKFYPRNLVDRILATYTFSYKNGGNGSYDMVLKIVYTTTVGRERVILWVDELDRRSGEFSGGFKESFTLKPEEINTRVENVSRQLGVLHLDHSVLLSAKVDGEQSFEHEIAVVSSGGLVYFQNEEESNVRPVVSTREQKSKFAGLDIDTARMLFTLPLAVTVPLAAYSGKGFVKRGKRLGIERFAVNGRVPISGNVVYVENESDIKKLFELLDKPIIRTSNGSEVVYVIIDGETIYVYRSSS